MISRPAVRRIVVLLAIAAALFVAKGKALPFTSWDALIGKRGVAMVGDSYAQEFDDFAAANLPLTRVTTGEAAFDMLSSGTADYFLYSLYAGDDVRAFGVFDKRVARCRPNVPQRARGT